MNKNGLPSSPNLALFGHGTPAPSAEKPNGIHADVYRVIEIERCKCKHYFSIVQGFARKIIIFAARSKPQTLLSTIGKSK